MKELSTNTATQKVQESFLKTLFNYGAYNEKSLKLLAIVIIRIKDENLARIYLIFYVVTKKLTKIYNLFANCSCNGLSTTQSFVMISVFTIFIIFSWNSKYPKSLSFICGVWTTMYWAVWSLKNHILSSLTLPFSNQKIFRFKLFPLKWFVYIL